jgi:hypothetical protein
MEILQNERLIEVNQDSLAVQGTLRVAFDSSGTRAPTVTAPPATCVTDPTPCPQASPWVTHCSFGSPVNGAQRWEIRGKLLVQIDGVENDRCLARLPVAHRSLDEQVVSVAVVNCDPSSLQQAWNFGSANSTVAQVRDAADSTSCLTFNSSSLHMEACQNEKGDKTTPNKSGCTDGNCRFSSIIYQLWYLNSLRQFTSAITNIQNGPDALLPMIPNFPSNTPWCLATGALINFALNFHHYVGAECITVRWLSIHAAPHVASAPAPGPEIDSSMPLQVWAGPLSGGDVVVLLLNTGNGTKQITASWEDIGLKSGANATATDLWTGHDVATPLSSSISASVASHDSAVFRLSLKQ